MMTGSLNFFLKDEKNGCSLIRACSLIRSNTVCTMMARIMEKHK